jgi:hypothetical protein
MARTLLYGDTTIEDPLADNLHPSSHLAHSRATAPDSIRGILPIANGRWKQTKGDRWFAPSHQHILPGQWAHQILHLNITNALTSHITRCSQAGRPANHTPRRRPYTLGQNSPSRGPTTVLDTNKTRTTLHLVPHALRMARASNLSTTVATAI